jgi:hypothetical protein
MTLVLSPLVTVGDEVRTDIRNLIAGNDNYLDIKQPLAATYTRLPFEPTRIISQDRRPSWVGEPERNWVAARCDRTQLLDPRWGGNALALLIAGKIGNPTAVEESTIHRVGCA